MSVFRKPFSFLLVSALSFTMLLPGCGQKEADIAVDSSDIAAVEQSGNAAEDAPKAESTKTVAVVGNKNIVVVLEDSQDIRTKAKDNFLKQLKEKAGLDDSNTQITIINLEGDEKKGQECLERIKAEKPDVVVIFNGSFANNIIAGPLEGTGIPVLVCSVAEVFTDSNGVPKGNVTGVTSMPGDLRYNAFQMLNKISPINGKQAVFVTTEGVFVKNDIEEDLSRIGIKLKDYCESKYVEDFMAAVEKYNQDDEVGWILVGVWPTAKKDGSICDLQQTSAWDLEHRKKPTVTFWETAVQMGLLCGLGVDLIDLGNQMGEMAIRVLDGENVKSITAQEPRRTTIVLNQKRADQLGIKFPADLLGSAKVYTDFEGNYLK